MRPPGRGSSATSSRAAPPERVMIAQFGASGEGYYGAYTSPSAGREPLTVDKT